MMASGFGIVIFFSYPSHLKIYISLWMRSYPVRLSSSAKKGWMPQIRTKSY